MSYCTADPLIPWSSPFLTTPPIPQSYCDFRQALESFPLGFSQPQEKAGPGGARVGETTNVTMPRTALQTQRAEQRAWRCLVRDNTSLANGSTAQEESKQNVRSRHYRSLGMGSLARGSLWLLHVKLLLPRVPGTRMRQMRDQGSVSRTLSHVPFTRGKTHNRHRQHCFEMLIILGWSGNRWMQLRHLTCS